jgi:hypothetical protein
MFMLRNSRRFSLVIPTSARAGGDYLTTNIRFGAIILSFGITDSTQFPGQSPGNTGLPGELVPKFVGVFPQVE